MRHALLAASSALIVEDCMQTVAFRREGFTEQNPLLGATPTTERIWATCAAGLALNYGAWRVKPAIAVLVIAVEAWVIASNMTVNEGGRSMRVGIRFAL